MHCRFDNGSVKALPVWQALTDSHRIVGIDVEVPTMLPAILRQLLLPITMHALGSPSSREEWGQRFKQGRFATAEIDALDTYLAEHGDRFDVLHPVHPFGQVAGLRTKKGETKGSALLVATAPSGNNVPLFATRTEADVLRLPLDAAVRWMLHAQCWDTAAIKTGVVGDLNAEKTGKTSGNPTGPLGQLGVVMPVGRTLYETLLLNSPIGVQRRLGLPHWARDHLGPQWEVRAPEGLLDLWTWQSRRIRLIPEGTDHGVVVERVVLSAGDRFSVGVPVWETHTAWRKDKPNTRSGATRSGAAALRPLRHTAGKAAWRGLDALLALEKENGAAQTSELIDQIAGLDAEGVIDVDYPLRLETFAIVYGNQSAVIEELIHDVVPLPVASLRGTGPAYDVVVDAATQAEQLVNAINHLSADLRRAVGADPIPWNKGIRPGEQLLAALDPLVRRLLAGVSADSGDEDKLTRGREAWELMAFDAVHRCATPLFALPSAAFHGRSEKSGSKEHHYKLGLAANSFHVSVNNILSRAAALRKRSNEKEQTYGSTVLEQIHPRGHRETGVTAG
ncbi:type I-E CRISPR-associated protein Cse1/CasA [Nocardia speluncae]|uniref:Type I-E CRISPR-associated protein Cse1/CasA n=1 Tax=Nocardia speluncae TaxID=419477 RepID=A0A846XD60_9NOCA|nr:type I-E CRISPR-associated protein Cse1/CasA [Nocardia speluncae]NKY33872.1 type I-E CRISPR-associated protein Cse1/CasA [Nocardia speluncae]